MRRRHLSCKQPSGFAKVQAKARVITLTVQLFVPAFNIAQQRFPLFCLNSPRDDKSTPLQSVLIYLVGMAIVGSRVR